MAEQGFELQKEQSPLAEKQEEMQQRITEYLEQQKNYRVRLPALKTVRQK